MKLTIADTNHIDANPNAAPPLITIEHSEIRDRATMSGFPVATIDVQHADGRITRFWINASLNSNDNVVIETSTIVRRGQDHNDRRSSLLAGQPQNYDTP